MILKLKKNVSIFGNSKNSTTFATEIQTTKSVYKSIDMTHKVITSTQAKVKVTDFPFLVTSTKINHLKSHFRLPKIKRVDDRYLEIVRFKNGIVGCIFTPPKTLDFTKDDNITNDAINFFLNSFIETNADLDADNMTDILVTQHNSKLNKVLAIFHVE